MTTIPLNETHANDLFKFVNIRPPKPLKTDKKTDQFPAFFSIPYDPSNAQERSSRTSWTETGLYPKLLLASEKEPTAFGKIRKVIVTYKGTADYIFEPDDFPTQFASLASFVDWLDSNVDAAGHDELSKKVNEIFSLPLIGLTDATDFIETRCRLWDNLLVAVLAPQDPFLLTLSCKYLGALYLLEVCSKNLGSESNNIKLPLLYRAKPLLPTWIVKLLVQRTDRKDSDGFVANTSGDVSAKLLKKYTELVSSVDELNGILRNRLMELRVQSQKFGPAAQPGSNSEQLKEVTFAVDPALFEKKHEEQLSAKTKEIVEMAVKGWQLFDLNELIYKLSQEANVLASQLGNENREYSLKIGQSIVDRNAFCADMSDKDPCAIGPRKTFSSRGSYVNGMLVGDLLVTRQQLIKYAPGEVAHVEAVMAGLKKQRTHRNLRRTETTTTFERESINETERETQTTERFSIEKESTKTLAQDFSISAGINVSGDYGVTTVTSNMDASFGISTTQSDQNATKFSRDVTDRALSRVKQTVRETQTVTIINETEETSLNRIKNETTDSINGVYRWLDKYYLNKIVNYGKRLMFEFAVPEPANFHIFRKLSKPKAGEVVEKPIHPHDWLSPTGTKLTSPNELSDTNYGAWISKYDVASADAPPQQFIEISKAFNSGESDGTNQYINKSFGIELLDGYEAIWGLTRGYASSWGSDVFHLEVVVGDKMCGYVNSFSLPKIKTVVGVAINSRSIQWAITVTIMAERSPESFEAWRLKTYAKIVEAYAAKKRDYDEWLNAQSVDNAFGFNGGGSNPGINRATEREELQKRCLELFTGQRWESFDAATNGIQNSSGYPEILFEEAIREGNLAKFFQQAFEWENMTYIFYPYYYGRKNNWLAVKNIEDPSDPLFTAFLQSGMARVNVPVRPNFENYIMVFNILANAISELGCSWNFEPGIFGTLGVSNAFGLGIDDPTYMSVTQELAAAQGMTVDSSGVTDNSPPNVTGHYIQKVPTNLVYVVPNSWTPPSAGQPTNYPGLPDNSLDADIVGYL